MSPMSPTSMPLNRLESAGSTIIQEFDRALSTSTDIGEIYETVMQHACAGALVARAREVTRREAVPAVGVYPRPYPYPNASDSQQSTASMRAGPRSADSQGSGAPPRPPTGGSASASTEEGAPGFRSRGGAADTESSSLASEADPEAESAQLHGQQASRDAAVPAFTEEQVERVHKMAALTNFGRRTSLPVVQQSPQRRASDVAGTSHSQSPSVPDSSEAYFGQLPVQQQQQPRAPDTAAGASQVAGESQAGGSKSISRTASGNALSRTVSGDITPRLHGLPAAVAGSSEMAPYVGGADSPSTAGLRGVSGATGERVHGSLVFWSDDIRSTAFTTTSFAKRVSSPRMHDSTRTSTRSETRESTAPTQSGPSVTAPTTPPDKPSPMLIAFRNPPSTGAVPTPSFPGHFTDQIPASDPPDVLPSAPESTEASQEPPVGGAYSVIAAADQRRFLESPHTRDTHSSVETILSASEASLQPASISSVSGAYHSRYQPHTNVSSSASVQRPQTYYDGGHSTGTGSGNPWSQGIEPSSSTMGYDGGPSLSFADLAPHTAIAPPGSGSTGSLSTAPTFAAGLPEHRSKIAALMQEQRAARTGMASYDSNASPRGASTDTQQTRSTVLGSDSLVDMPHIPSDMSMSGALHDSAVGATGATLANWVGSVQGLSDTSRLPISQSRSFTHSMSQSLSNHSLTHSMTQSLHGNFRGESNSNGVGVSASETSSDVPPLPHNSRSSDSVRPLHSVDSVSSGSASGVVPGAARGAGSGAPRVSSEASRANLMRLLPAGLPSQIPKRPGSNSYGRYGGAKPPVSGRRGHAPGSRGAGSVDAPLGSRGRSSHGRYAHGRSRGTSSASGASGGISLRATSTTGTQSAAAHSLSSEVLMPTQQPSRRGAASQRGGRPAQRTARMHALHESDEQAQLDVASVSASSAGGSTTVAVASSASTGGAGLRRRVGGRTHAFVGDHQMSDRLEPTHQRSLITTSQRAAEHWSTPADIRARTTSPRTTTAGAPVATGHHDAPGAQNSRSRRYRTADSIAPSHSSLSQRQPSAPRPQARIIPQLSHSSHTRSSAHAAHPQHRHSATTTAVSRESTPSSRTRSSPHSPNTPPTGTVPLSPHTDTSQPQHIAAAAHVRHSTRSTRSTHSAQSPRPQSPHSHLDSRPEGSVTFEGLPSPATASPPETAPHAASAWYAQPPQQDRSTSNHQQSNADYAHSDGGASHGMHDSWRQLSHSRSAHSSRGEAHGGDGGMEGGSHSPKWARRSLSLSQTDLRLADLEERLSRQSPADNGM